MIRNFFQNDKSPVNFNKKKSMRAKVYAVSFLFFLFLGIGVLYKPAFAQQMTAEQRLQRERELQAQLEAEIREIEKKKAELQVQQKHSASLQQDISLLNAEIRRAQLQIQNSNISINGLQSEIARRNQTIEELIEKMEREKASLSELVRKTHEMDSFTMVEVFLGTKNLSEFFSDVDSYSVIKDSLHRSFEEVREVKGFMEAEKEALSLKVAQETDIRKNIEAEKRSVERNEAERKRLLQISKSEEASYQQIIREREANAAAIRAALFSLRDTADIPFGTALTYANQVSQRTGVRPAFLLAIITQESNLGQNVGSCVITDLQTGQTRGVNSGRIFSNGIHPTRDLPHLQTIVTELGRDPMTTRVSCPLNIGYGGAMGPAQFIPSTWQSIRGRLGTLLSKSMPDPWNPFDAFMASGLYLSDLGASARTYSAEHQAAARYYAGGNWATLGQGYASSVMAHAVRIQEQMIDPLEGY